MSTDQDDRLKRIEDRLAAIEARLNIQPAPTPLPKAATPLPGARPDAPAPQPKPTTTTPHAGISVPVTAILGWGGVAALVLATAYLIRLAIDSGFLTPERQVGMAAIFGVGLIATGMILRESLRRYASLLPAGGIAVLFLTIYGGHLYHGLFGAVPAAIAVVIVCAISLGLRDFYDNDFFTFFAVIGSYTGPLFLHILNARPLDIVIYFLAWDVLFCLYAFRAKRRSVYLLAAYLALIVFDANWRMANMYDWIWAASFQAVQFVLFLAVTAIYSIRHQQPLRRDEAIVHLPPLLFFYAVEYGLLSQYASNIAPWLAMASIIPMAVVYVIIQGRLPENARAGEVIITAYTAIVLFHAGYMELLPDGWRELAGLLALIVLGIVGLKRASLLNRHWPFAVAIGIIAAVGLSRLLTGYELKHVMGWRILLPLYAATLYAVYWVIRSKDVRSTTAYAALYFGHLTVMAGIVHMSHSRLLVSIVWGLLAVAALIVSMSTGDRRLGQSALLVFAGFALKVLLFDLSGASQLVRIGCLVVLGITMYAGGILYQRIDKPATDKT